MQEQEEQQDFVQENDFIFDELDIAQFRVRLGTYSKGLNHTVFKPAKLKTIKEEREGSHKLTTGWTFFIR